MANKPIRERDEFTVAFLCPECMEFHPSPREARACCPPDIEKVYVCNNCESEHQTAKAARNCCSYWVCENCGEEYDTKSEAKKCCHEEEQ